MPVCDFSSRCPVFSAFHIPGCVGAVETVSESSAVAGLASGVKGARKQRRCTRGLTRGKPSNAVERLDVSFVCACVSVSWEQRSLKLTMDGIAIVTVEEWHLGRQSTIAILSF